jgi:hypothetical protein
MTRYRVETRATVVRHRYVEADNEKEAEAKSSEAPIAYEEDENEETMAIMKAAADE